jgi:hypothetical protein
LPLVRHDKASEGEVGDSGEVTAEEALRHDVEDALEDEVRDGEARMPEEEADVVGVKCSSAFVECWMECVMPTRAADRTEREARGASSPVTAGGADAFELVTPGRSTARFMTSRQSTQIILPATLDQWRESLPRRVFRPGPTRNSRFVTTTMPFLHRLSMTFMRLRELRNPARSVRTTDMIM